MQRSRQEEDPPSSLRISHLLASSFFFSFHRLLPVSIQLTILVYPKPISKMLSRSPQALLSAIRPSLRLARLSTPAAVHVHSQPKHIRSSLQQFSRSFHPTPTARKGLQPDSSDPKPPNGNSQKVAGAAVHVTEPSPLTNEQYYEYSEHYLNVVIGEVEKLQEEGSDIEAEYSVRLTAF